jgi:plasmid stabilization system protein ParE
MARQIIWSLKAEKLFLEILEFYAARNSSKTYSNRIYKETTTLLNHLSKFPYLGKRTTEKKIRILIKSHYKIFYKIEPNSIIVLLIWDSRQDPSCLYQNIKST